MANSSVDAWSRHGPRGWIARSSRRWWMTSSGLAPRSSPAATPVLRGRPCFAEAFDLLRQLPDIPAWRAFTQPTSTPGWQRRRGRSRRNSRGRLTPDCCGSCGDDLTLQTGRRRTVGLAPARTRALARSSAGSATVSCTCCRYPSARQLTTPCETRGNHGLHGVRQVGEGVGPALEAGADQGRPRCRRVGCRGRTPPARSLRCRGVTGGAGRHDVVEVYPGCRSPAPLAPPIGPC
jgi:hypothetical protein